MYNLQSNISNGNYCFVHESFCGKIYFPLVPLFDLTCFPPHRLFGIFRFHTFAKRLNGKSSLP